MLKVEDFAMKTFGKLSSTHTKKVLVVTHGFETFLNQNANFMMLIYCAKRTYFQLLKNVPGTDPVLFFFSSPGL